MNQLKGVGREDNRGNQGSEDEGVIDSSSSTPTLKIIFLNVNDYSYNDIQTAGFFHTTKIWSPFHKMLETQWIHLFMNTEWNL